VEGVFSDEHLYSDYHPTARSRHPEIVGESDPETAGTLKSSSSAEARASTSPLHRPRAGEEDVSPGRANFEYGAHSATIALRSSQRTVAS
jgi:hypothetical protein